MSSTTYAPVSFNFEVAFTGLEDAKSEVSFQSVTGLSIDLETEDIAEGGENRFKHSLPVKTKYPNLILKRGLLVDSKVIDWCRDALENFNFKPIDLMVTLLNDQKEALMSWSISHAYPVKYALSDLNAEESKIMIETLELKYNFFTTKLGSNGD